MISTLGSTRVEPPPGTYQLEHRHCLAMFEVRHLLLSTVRGALKPVEGSLVVDPVDVRDSWVRVDFDAASIDTGSARRDAVLRGPQFLDAERFPFVRFESTELVPTRPGRYLTYGDLYLKDQVAEVVLDTRLVALDDDRVSFAAHATVSRASYGFGWSRTQEAFGLVVSDAVRVTAGAEFMS
jgi:polyisoprenoid-binding protein YceI